MECCDVTARFTQTQYLACCEVVSLSNIDGREVCVYRDGYPSVVEPDNVAEARHGSGESDTGFCHRFDGCSCEHVEINATVGVRSHAQEAEA